MANPLIKISVSQADATLLQTCTLTAGMQNTPTVKFSFSDEWTGLGKTAVVRAGSTILEVLIINNQITVPVECLESSGVNLIIGVYGTDTSIAIPTVWCSAGEILDGTDVDEPSNVGEATESLVDQMITYAGHIDDVADALEDNVITEAESIDTDANQYGTATVGVDLVNASATGKKLKLTFENLKGNGVTDIVYSNSGEYKGRIVFKTNQYPDGDESTTFDALIEPIQYFEEKTNRSQAYAVGTTGEGEDEEPVPSTDPAYQNNSKYYAEQAAETVKAFVAAENAYSEKQSGFVFVSGSYNTSTGAAVSDNTRIRAQGINPINVSKGDIVIMDAPYSAILLFYNKVAGTSTFVGATSDYERLIEIDSQYVGKDAVLLIRNDDTPTSNISSQTSLAKAHTHYWSSAKTIDDIISTQKSVFKYTFTNYSFYNGQRLSTSTGGSEDSTNVLGMETYLEASFENPVLIEVSDDVLFDVLFYGGNTQGTYVEHTGLITGTLILNGTYNGISFKTIRLNLKWKTGNTITDAAEIISKLTVRRTTAFWPASPSGLSTADKRFTVKVNLNWPDTESTATDTEETDTNTDILCILRLPATYQQSGKPTPLIMLGHGASGQITNSMWYSSSSNFSTMVNAFVNDGFAVFDVNNTRNASGGFPDWGCLPLMSAYIKAWEYIKKNYNVEKKLYLLSFSMGTAANLNMMKWYGSEIVTSIMTAPRPLCKARYENYEAGGTLQANMASAFGLTNLVWDNDRLIGFNHYENIVTIGETPVVLENFPPVKVMVGQSDTQFIDEVRAYYTALSNNGNFVNYREVSGADHAKISFLADSALRSEALAWFNRFRYQEAT